MTYNRIIEDEERLNQIKNQGKEIGKSMGYAILNSKTHDPEDHYFTDLDFEFTEDDSMGADLKNNFVDLLKRSGCNINDKSKYNMKIECDPESLLKFIQLENAFRDGYIEASQKSLSRVMHSPTNY